MASCAGTASSSVGRVPLHSRGLGRRVVCSGEADVQDGTGD